MNEELWLLTLHLTRPCGPLTLSTLDLWLHNHKVFVSENYNSGVHPFSYTVDVEICGSAVVDVCMLVVWDWAD